MKKIFLIAIMAMLTLVACAPSGTTERQELNQELLPPELKGLKIYNVATSLSYMRIAVLNNEVIACEYPMNKRKQDVAYVKRNNIIYENDSIIILRK